MTRGAYGTNEGDIWTAPPDSQIQRQMDAEGQGFRLIIEMMVAHGELQEVIYATQNPEIIAEAVAGNAKREHDKRPGFGLGSTTTEGAA